MSDERDDERAIRNLVARYCHAIAERDDGEWRFARRELHATYLGPPDLSAAPARPGQREGTP